MDESVVRTAPEQSRFVGRLFGCKNGGVVLHPGIVLGNRTTRAHKLFGVVAGEVGGDDFPAFAPVGGAVQELRTGVQHLVIVWREEHREIPLKAVLHGFCPSTKRVVGPHMNGTGHIGVVVLARQKTAVATAVNNVVIGGVRRNVSAFAACCRLPVFFGDEATVRAALDAYGGVVLLSAVNAVGEMVVGGHAVELRGGLVFVGGPIGAAVVGHLAATVVADDHAVGVFRGNPQVVVIAVWSVAGLEGFATVGGGVVSHVHDVDFVDIFCIGVDARVVPRTLTQAAVAVGFGPGLAAVVRTEHTAFVVFNDGPKAIRIDR